MIRASIFDLRKTLIQIFLVFIEINFLIVNIFPSAISFGLVCFGMGAEPAALFLTKEIPHLELTASDAHRAVEKTIEQFQKTYPDDTSLKNFKIEGIPIEKRPIRVNLRLAKLSIDPKKISYFKIDLERSYIFMIGEPHEIRLLKSASTLLNRGIINLPL